MNQETYGSESVAHETNQLAHEVQLLRKVVAAGFLLLTETIARKPTHPGQPWREIQDVETKAHETLIRATNWRDEE